MARARDLTMGQPDDAALVVAARHGSREAFDQLVERHYTQVLRALVRQTGYRDLAADLAQDTFLDAFRHLDRLTDEQAFVVWLYGIARNHLRMAGRKQHLRQILSLDWLLGRAGGQQGSDERHAALRQHDGSAGCHERDHIQRVLDKLSPALREALLLSSVWGFSGQEIAHILGIAPAAVRQRVGRAKEQFR